MCGEALSADVTDFTDKVTVLHAWESSRHKGKELSEIYEKRDRLLMRMTELLEEMEEELWSQ